MQIEAYMIVIPVVVILSIIFLIRGIKIVPQGYQCTVERFGKYTRTLTPGLSLINPITQRIGSKISMMENVLDVPTQEVITKDNAMVSADGVIFFQVIEASKAAYEVSNLNLAILNLTMTNIRSVMGSMDLDELLSKRDEINTKLLGIVDDATTPWGVKITRIEIKDITPPKDLVEALSRQMKAEREKRAAILEAQGQRQSEIEIAEGEKKSAILKAEGERQSAFLEAEARERLAQAEANATTMVSKAIDEGNSQAINYFLGQKYIEAMKELANSPNPKMVLVPMEMNALAGSIAGIGSIADSLKNIVPGNPGKTTG